MRDSRAMNHLVAVLMKALMCVALLFASSSGRAQDDGCGPLVIQGIYGPFDYRTDQDKLSIVEGAHFTPLVENLIQPMFQFFGPDISYTLRSFPNHHRALMTLTKLSLRDKSLQPKGSLFTTDCWFKRAIRFAKDDMIVKMLYAKYLAQINRKPEAMYQLELAAKGAGEDPFTHYNVAAIYYEFKEYDKSAAEAQRAYALGFEQPELKDKLISLGKWPKSAEPDGQASAAAASMPASAAAARSSAP